VTWLRLSLVVFAGLLMTACDVLETFESAPAGPVSDVEVAEDLVPTQTPTATSTRTSPPPTLTPTPTPKPTSTPTSQTFPANDVPYVVLIQGLTSKGVSNCQNSSQDDLIIRWREAIQTSLGIPADQVLVLSYTNQYCDGEQYRFPIYTALDTCHGIDEAVAALDELIEETLVLEDGQASFHIVGHSLGGFIAAYWVSLGAQTLPYVNSVITLDAPLGEVPDAGLVGGLLFPSCLDESRPGHESTLSILDADVGLESYVQAVENPQLTTDQASFANLYCTEFDLFGGRACLGEPVFDVPVTMSSPWRTRAIQGDLDDGQKLDHVTLIFHQDTLAEIADIFNFDFSQIK